MKPTYSIAALAIAVLFGVRPSAADLIGHWKLDETSGTTAVDSVNGNNGTYVASDDPEPGWQSGLIGGAAGLNDEDDGFAEYFSVASIPQIANLSQLSISIWFNSNDGGVNGGNQGLFRTDGIGTTDSRGGRTGGLNTESGHIDARIRDGGDHDADGGSFNYDPGWHHALMTWDATEESNGAGTGTLRVYVDGQLGGMESTTGLAEPLPELSGIWDIGNDGCCGGRAWTGALDDLAIWDEKLSPELVDAIYFDGLFGIDAATSYADATSPFTLGDVTGEGDVNSADLAIIKQNFGQAFGYRNDGDLVNNNFIDLDDYLQWKLAVKDPEALATVSGSVPEPATWSLVAIIASLCLLRRRV